MVEYKCQDKYVEENLDTNCIVASFVTGHARLHLYSVLEQLDRRCCYYDTGNPEIQNIVIKIPVHFMDIHRVIAYNTSITYTFIHSQFTNSSVLQSETLVPHFKTNNIFLYYFSDSCIYLKRPQDPELPLGDFLGDLTSEIPEGVKMNTFVCAGPKNYAYLMSDGTSICKVKGFTLNFTNAQKINFDVLQQRVKHFLEPDSTEPAQVLIHNPRDIKRNKKRSEVYNKALTKQYSVCFEKRVVVHGGDSLPFGY